MKTVVGLFDSFSHAQHAVSELETAGISRNEISVVANNQNNQFANTTSPSSSNYATEGSASGVGSEATRGAVAGGAAGLLVGLAPLIIPGLGAIAAVGWLATTLVGAGVGATVGLAGALGEAGVPQEDAAYYNEGVRQGGTLVIVKAENEMADRAAQILGGTGAAHIEEHADPYRINEVQASAQPAMYTPLTPTMPSMTTPSAIPMTQPSPAPALATSVMQESRTNLDTEGKTVLPVIEEELAVGKRQVETGGVRVSSRITERPVEEQVSLHEERVNVERRPVNRPIGMYDMDAFKEQTIEMRETAEEAVISKQARVVEEVVVGKEASDRIETIRETVRRTDVEVEQLGGQHTSRSTDFSFYDDIFRNNYRSNYASQGAAYEKYEPAYRYGYDLSSNTQYRNRDWASIEPQIRQDWERTQPNTWDQFKNSIRYAWDQATGADRGGIQTGGRALDGTQDTRGISEKIADAVTGDRVDDKTGKIVR